jgi:hypothetical protein
MYTHRGLTPFTNFLPVLVISNAEQHAVLSALGVLCSIKELATLSSITPCTSRIWHNVRTSPFGTITALRRWSERLPPPIVRFCDFTRLPDDNWSDSSFSPLSRWIHKSATTFGSTPVVATGSCRKISGQYSEQPHSLICPPPRMSDDSCCLNSRFSCRVFSTLRVGGLRSGETHEDLSTREQGSLKMKKNYLSLMFII